MIRTIALCVVIIFGSMWQGISWADDKTPDTGKTSWQEIFSDVIGHYPLPVSAINDDTPVKKGELAQPKNWEFAFGLQRFLMSHTSYEIGNSSAPFQKPLSRLEFPLDTWWLDLKVRRTCPRWSAGFRAGLSVANNIDGRMKDSDWENPANTQTVTTYSESALRANSNHLFRADVDVNISDWLGLPPGFEIRPLFAFQFQRFNLMAHDGTQWSVGNYDDDEAMAIDGPTNASSLDGDTIRFRQDYYMYHIGLKGSYDGFKINKYITIKVSGEADWGPALGYYKDHHLLRTGNLIAYCKSSGSSLYFATGVDMIIAKTITAGITMDYLWIRTTGVTRHTNFLMGEDMMWSDGVKTWSDQTSLMAHVSYAF